MIGLSLVGRLGAYPRVGHLQVDSLSQTLALFPNIRLGWKGLPGTNALAYLAQS